MIRYLLRQKLILFRIHSSQTISIDDLAELFHISSKTIRSDLSVIEEMAGEYGLMLWQDGKNCSVTVVNEQLYREKMFEIALTYRCQKNILDEKASLNLQVATYMLLYPDMTVNEIANALYTSASTLRNCIKFARGFIDSYKKNISNQEFAFRLCYSSLSSAFLYEKDDVYDKYSDLNILPLLEKNGLKFNTQEAFLLVYYCGLTLDRIRGGHFIDEKIIFLPTDKLKNTKEYQIAGSYLKDCPEEYFDYEVTCFATLIILFKEFTFADLQIFPETWREEIKDLREMVSKEIEYVWGIDFSRFYEATLMYSTLAQYYLKRVISIDKAEFLPLFRDNRFNDYHPIEDAFAKSIKNIFADLTSYSIMDFDLYQLQNILFNKIYSYSLPYSKRKIIVSLIGGEKASLSYIDYLKATIDMDKVEYIRYSDITNLLLGTTDDEEWDILFTDIFIPSTRDRSIIMSFQRHYYSINRLNELLSLGVITDDRLLTDVERKSVSQHEYEQTLNDLLKPKIDAMHPYNINYSGNDRIGFVFVCLSKDDPDADRIVLLKPENGSIINDSPVPNQMLFFFHPDSAKMKYIGMISHLFLINSEYFDKLFNNQDVDEIIREIKGNLFLSTNYNVSTR